MHFLLHFLEIWTGGWVEDWRHTPQVQPIRCSPFPLGVPHEPNRKLISSPRHFKPIVPISSNGLTCSLPVKGYVTAPQVTNVTKNRHYPGCDFIARSGKKRIKIEVKGCGRPWGIPDLYFTEVTQKSKSLVADYLYVVYFIDRKSPRLCKIPRRAIKSKFFVLKRSYCISGRFKNERMLGRFMEKPRKSKKKK